MAGEILTGGIFIAFSAYGDLYVALFYMKFHSESHT